MAVRCKIEESEVRLKHCSRQKYCADYAPALVNRGFPTTWSDEASIAKSCALPRLAGRGKQGLYSDVAIQLCLTLKALFRQPYRIPEGLLDSLMCLRSPDFPVPNHEYLHIAPNCQFERDDAPSRKREATHVAIDSSGLKIFGRGEWNVRQHDVSKRRTWHKILLAKSIIGIGVAPSTVTTAIYSPTSLAKLPGPFPMSLRIAFTAPRKPMPRLARGRIMRQFRCAMAQRLGERPSAGPHFA